MAVRWGEKRYHSLDYHLKETYGEKLYKLSLNGGMTCPNRDGTVGTGGCIFCSQGGSGDFAAPSGLSISDQIQQAKGLVSRKYAGHSYIAYFQAYTNTYAPVDYLREIFTEALSHPAVAALSIGTRPDCLGPDVLELLEELNRRKPVWVELGLQTIHERTAAYIRRGYPLSCFEEAAAQLHRRNLDCIVHTILGLPGEDTQAVLETMEYLNKFPIQGIKLQLLHVLKGTDLAKDYLAGNFQVLSQEEYIRLVIACLTRLRPDIVIHRLTGDGPRDLLIAPLWSSAKRTVLNDLHHQMKIQGVWQGMYCPARYKEVTHD